MYCCNCGAENTEGAVFCEKCGQKIDGTASVKNKSEENTQKSSKKAIGIIILIIFALIILSIVFLWMKKPKPDNNVSDTMQQTANAETFEDIKVEDIKNGEDDATLNETVVAENNEYTSIHANSPYVFSEGYAWVNIENTDSLAVIDTDGNVKFTLDNTSEGIKIHPQDLAYNIIYDPIEATPFYDGASAVYPSRHLNAYGYAIYDSNGNLLTSSDDGDDMTDLRLLGAGEGIYLIEKETRGSVEDNVVFYCIDKNGNRVTDEIEITGRNLSYVPYHSGGWRYIGNRNFLEVGTSVGAIISEATKGIIDGNYVNLIENETYVYISSGNTGRVDLDTFMDDFVDLELKLNGNEELLAIMDPGELWLDRYEELSSTIENLPAWCDRNLEAVVKLPEFSQDFEVEKMGNFVGGFAPIQLMGLDGKHYFTVIDKAGNLMYEPVGGFDSVNGISSRNTADVFSTEGIITLLSDWRPYVIDKDGSVYDVSEDISDFAGNVYCDYDTEKNVIAIAEGFKYFPDDSTCYRKLDGTPLDKVVIGDDVVKVEFDQGYKKEGW